jgi:hypothetical protein
MSENGYFNKFPITNYSNNYVVDITKRATMLETVSSNPYIFYPYELSTYERPDQFSHRYFGDAYKSWILYLTNKIVDPYYEWYLTQDQFRDFLQKKYGTSQNAVQKIKYYRNDWYNAKDITVIRYDSLTPVLQKYWKPIYLNDVVTSYTRKQNDWEINTNKIASYGVANTAFVKDEICDVYFNANQVGRGQITFTGNNEIYLQHVSGYYLSNSSVSITGSSYIYGKESGVNTSISSTSLISSNLLPEEEIYWSAITYYDYEHEKNEYNKSIRILDKRLSDTVVNNLTDVMKE